MPDAVTFFVAGEPQPKGSTRAFVVKGRPIITSSNKNLKAWEQRIAHEAQAHIPAGFCDGESAYIVDCIFEFAEPKSHAKAYRYYHRTRPDADKLLRAVLDALTDITWHDDAQVVTATCIKGYGWRPGVTVVIQKLPGRVRID